MRFRLSFSISSSFKRLQAARTARISPDYLCRPHVREPSDRFEKAFQRIKGESTITEANIAETTTTRALVDADVNHSVAKRFANQVKDKAIGPEVLLRPSWSASR